MRKCLPTGDYESSLLAAGYRLIAGVDEVGRGSWAGPIVGAAVILPPLTAHVESRLTGLTDSKQLDPDERARLAAELRNLGAVIGLGWSSHHAIDRVGIGEANRCALLRAVRNLATPPDVLLVDHFRLSACGVPQIALSHGDARVLSIAAASVMAKVVRDRWMERCGPRYGAYGFERHKGYGTPEHRTALTTLGPSRLHRLSFAPCGDAPT